MVSCRVDRLPNEVRSLTESESPVLPLVLPKRRSLTHYGVRQVGDGDRPPNILFRRVSACPELEAADEKISLHELCVGEKDEPKMPTVIHMFDSG